MKHILQTLAFICLPFLALSQQSISGSIMHDGIERFYILYVPEMYSEEIATALILNLHGYGSNAAQQQWYADFRPIADTAGFLVLHPQGTIDNVGNAHWNVGWGTSDVDDVSFMAALLDSLAVDFNIDPDRIFSTGMSNGGFMSYKLACELSERIAAIASVTGTMNKNQPNDCFPEHPVPVMEIHGTADGTVPYDGASWIESVESVLEYWAGFNNCVTEPVITELPDTDPNDGCTVEHQLFSSGDNGVEVEHFKIINGGHTWPGNPFGGAGTCYDISASAEIWKFFLKYDINGLIIPTSIAANSGLNNAVHVYPNPVTNDVTIERSSDSPVAYSLYSPQGKMILSGWLRSEKEKLDMTGLNEGIYLLKVGNITHKVLKAR